MFFSSFVFSLKGALHWWNGVSPSKLAIYKIQAATGAKLFWMEWKVWTSCVPPAENRNYCVNVDQVWSNLPAVKLLPLKWNRIWAGATPMRAKWIKLDLLSKYRFSQLLLTGIKASQINIHPGNCIHEVHDIYHSMVGVMSIMYEVI